MAKCIERDAGMSWVENEAFQRMKKAGMKLFAPEQGGSYEVFNKRPLPEDLTRYCAQDVKVLSRPVRVYERRMGTVGRRRWRWRRRRG